MFRADGQSCCSHCSRGRRRDVRISADAQVLVGFSPLTLTSRLLLAQDEKTAGPTPCRFRDYEFLNLLFIDGFLQFSPGGKFRDLAGGDLDGGARLRIAPVPRLSL